MSDVSEGEVSMFGGRKGFCPDPGIKDIHHGGKLACLAMEIRVAESELLEREFGRGRASADIGTVPTGLVSELAESRRVISDEILSRPEARAIRDVLEPVPDLVGDSHAGHDLLDDSRLRQAAARLAVAIRLAERVSGQPGG
jgi:hypothetical protein